MLPSKGSIVLKLEKCRLSKVFLILDLKTGGGSIISTAKIVQDSGGKYGIRTLKYPDRTQNVFLKHDQLKKNLKRCLNIGFYKSCFFNKSGRRNCVRSSA